MKFLPSRRYDRWTSTLLFADFALGHLGTFIAQQGLYGPAASNSAIALGIALAVLLLALIICIRNGYRWAKILYVALFALGLLTLPLTYATLFATAWATVRYVTHCLFQFVASICILEGFRADKRAAGATAHSPVHRQQ